MSEENVFVLAQKPQSHHCQQKGNFTDNNLLRTQPWSSAAIISCVPIERWVPWGGENSLFIWLEFSVPAQVRAMCRTRANRPSRLAPIWLAACANARSRVKNSRDRVADESGSMQVWQIPKQMKTSARKRATLVTYVFVFLVSSTLWIDL